MLVTLTVQHREGRGVECTSPPFSTLLRMQHAVAIEALGDRSRVTIREGDQFCGAINLWLKCWDPCHLTPLTRANAPEANVPE